MNAQRIIVFGVTLLAACSETPPPRAATNADAKVEPATPVPNTQTDAQTDAKTDAKTAQPLSAEDERLIAADPKTLTPEDRRKRAYAMRRKIMQNPDSETAKMLEDLRRAAENGELQPPGKDGTMQFSTRTAPGAPPAVSSPPAGTPTSAADAPKAT